MTDLSALTQAALEREATAPALCFDGHWHSWGDIKAMATGVERALVAAGVAPDAPIAFVPRNRPEAIAALLGFLAAGRSVRMIYAFQSAGMIAAGLSRPGVAGVVLHSQDMDPAIAECAITHGLGVVAIDEAAQCEVVIAAGTGTDLAGSGDEPRIEILTSGTTGPPKHFPVPFALIEQHFISTPLTRAQGSDPALAPPFLLYFPLGNITGLYSTLPTLLRGQRVVLLERFSVAAWHAYVLEYRPAHSGVPPSAVRQILEADIPPADLASVKMMGIGAAPLDPAIQLAFEARYGIPILLSYGATEFAGPVTMMSAELYAEWGTAKRGSVGRAMPGVQLQVIDQDTGMVLGAGETGLLQVVSPRIGPEWIITSDLACLDADGFLFLKGRADGAIMRGGFKILPETIEAALLLHPAVAEAAVIGLPDARVGQVPAAVVCLSPGAPPFDSAVLEAHVRQHCLATHVPAHWLVRAELPRTPSLKVDRQALKRLFSEGLNEGAW